MATWSSFEKDKLITEGWRDFFKKKKESAGTYPASELTTIVNLISNLAKKLKIDIDISKIVDEFETILKSQNYNLQEQEDKIMIGGDVNLDLSKAPTLKTFMDAVAAQNPEGLKILLKALGRGAFDVSKYKPAASTEQTSIEEPEQATPATVETDFPIQITVDEFSKFIDQSNFETIKKMFNKLGVNKETEEIKQKFKSLLPPLFKSFDKALVDSDVGEYFRLQTQVKETINIEDRLGDYSNPQSNLYIFLFGALLKNYIQKRSNEVDAIVGDLPNEELAQLKNSVSGLTNKTLKSILGSKRDAGKPTAEPALASDKKEPETDQMEPAPSTEPAEPEASAPDTSTESEPEPAQPEPEVNQEPASEPQATEEPLKIITKILGEKGVSEEKVNAFIDDLKNMGVIQEIANRTLQKSLKMNKAEWEEFSQKHKEVIEAIGKLGGRSKAATVLRAQFKDALSKIITRTNTPRSKRGSRKKKSADRPASKSEPTPAAENPAESEPEAASPEPEARQETAPEAAPEQQPEEEKQLDISQIEENVLEAWRDYYNKDLKEPSSMYSPGTMKRKMKKVEGVIDAQDIEEGVIVRFADIRNNKNEPYNAFIVPKRREEDLSYIKKYYNIKNQDETEKVRVKDIGELAEYILYDIDSTKYGKVSKKGELEVVGSENSEAPQPPPKSKKKGPPPAKNQEAYKHGKQGKSMTSQGELKDQRVLPSAIDNIIRRLNSNKPSSEDQEKQDLRDKIESYIDGLYAFKDKNETSGKLEESLMLRWKTIAGIK
jgi:hypothetical protein